MTITATEPKKRGRKKGSTHTEETKAKMREAWARRREEQEYLKRVNSVEQE